MPHREWERFAELVRAMSAERNLTETLETAVHGAVELIDGCDHAGVSVVHRDGRITTEAATSDVVTRGDQLQYELREGPCLQAIIEEETVHSDDLTTENRWPEWSKRVADELGVRSMLCLQLFVTDDVIGALNLYSDSLHGFTSEDRPSALALAANVAAAMTAARQEEHYRSALSTRTTIGQAQGRLMERFDLTAEQAFAVLVRVSQHRNVKLNVITADVAANGIKPSLLEE